MRLRNSKYTPDIDISSGQRIINTDGSKYDYLFPKAELKDTVWIENGEVEDTVKLIERVVWTYINDTKQIASILKRDKTEETLKAIWDFLYHNIQYKLDQNGLEELRRPARAWKDRITGIDCDCFSIFCSSILCNLGIPHKFRITKYTQSYWQHIYVIVPKSNQQGYWTIDAVLSAFDYEKPFTNKMDYTMSLDGIKIAVLSGIDDAQTSGILMNKQQIKSVNNHALNASIFAHDLRGLGINDDLLGSIKNEDLEDGLYHYLLATRQTISENPDTALIAGYNHDQILQMLDYAIQYWYSEQRDTALDYLHHNEELINQSYGLNDETNSTSDEEQYGDDDIFANEADLLGKTNKAPKNVKKKAFFKNVGNSLKQVGKGIIKFNPASIAARNGFLLALKLNVGKISEKLKWAYASTQQINSNHINSNTVNKAKIASSKIEKMFVKLGGKAANIRKAILSAKQGHINGLGQLGVVPAAAAITAATPIIVASIKILKESGLIGQHEQVDISNIGLEQVDNTTNTLELIPNQQSNIAENSNYGNEINDNSNIEGLGNIGETAMTFARNNPILSIAIGGTIIYGIYELMSIEKYSSPKKSLALSGIKNKKIQTFTL